MTETGTSTAAEPVASTTRFGALTAAIIFVADQISKLWILFWVRLEDTGPWQVLPFMEFVMVWNRGISYGLFQQSSNVGRWALVVLSIAASVWLATWLRRSVRKAEALALGLIIYFVYSVRHSRLQHGIDTGDTEDILPPPINPR